MFSNAVSFGFFKLHVFHSFQPQVMMNSMIVPSKRSTLEKKLDKLILTIFVVLFFMCLIGAIGRYANFSQFWFNQNFLLTPNKFKRNIQCHVYIIFLKGCTLVWLYNLDYWLNYESLELLMRYNSYKRLEVQTSQTSNIYLQ